MENGPHESDTTDLSDNIIQEIFCFSMAPEQGIKGGSKDTEYTRR